MFENFPKKRLALPKEYEMIYTSHYFKNREGKTSASSLSHKMEEWMHRKVAADVKNYNRGEEIFTLEIGAGTLNQFHYEDAGVYDIVEPFKVLYESSEYLKNVRNIYENIYQVDGLNKYDRITSIATFEHILDLPEVVEKSCKLLKTNGCLRVAIPNEGTILWILGWKLTTGIEFKLKYKLNYKLLMEYEHVNTAKEIEKVLKYYYKDVHSKSFGINKYIAFYRFFECKNPI